MVYIPGKYTDFPDIDGIPGDLTGIRNSCNKKKNIIFLQDSSGTLTVKPLIDLNIIKKFISFYTNSKMIVSFHH